MYLALIPPHNLCPRGVPVREPISEFRHLFGPADLILVVLVRRPVIRGPVAVLEQSSRLRNKLIVSRALPKVLLIFLTSSATVTSPGICSATVKTPSERSRGDSLSLL